MKHLFLTLACFATCLLYADNYYSQADNKQDEALKTALHDIISANPTRYAFGSGARHTWAGFYYTDRREDNSVWDMYSNVTRYFGEMNASIEGIDIEHTFPKSWWGGSVNDGYKDLHLLTPADYSANRSKSNNAIGVVVVPNFDNGSFKVGKNPDYGDFKVFEPADEYKGDFARIFFYVATCYQDYPWVLDNSKYGSFYALSDNYLTFQPWVIDILLDWHRKDPVSVKERNRMEEVYIIQGNRNPFIEYPCLVEYIWGDRRGEAVHFNDLVNTSSDERFDVLNDQSGCQCVIEQPTLVRPLSNSVFEFEEASRNENITASLRVYAAQLSEPLKFHITGADSAYFSLKQSSLTAAQANRGTNIEITFSPISLGQHTALLHIESSEVKDSITLKGLCSTVFHAFNATDVSESSFVAQWSDAEVESYSLDVYQYPMLCSDSLALDLNPITIANINAQYKDNFRITGSVITYRSMLKLGSLERHGDVTIAGLPLYEHNHLLGSATQYEQDNKSSLIIIADNDTLATYQLDSTLTEFEIELPDSIDNLQFVQGDTTQRILIGYLTISTCHRKPTRQSLDGYPKDIHGTNFRVDYQFADENDSVYYQVTPFGGKISEEIVVKNSPNDALEINEINRIKYVTLDGYLHLFDLEPESRINLYNSVGQLVYTGTNAMDECRIPLYNHGLYIIQIDNKSTHIIY